MLRVVNNEELGKKKKNSSKPDSLKVKDLII